MNREWLERRREGRVKAIEKSPLRPLSAYAQIAQATLTLATLVVAVAALGLWNYQEVAKRRADAALGAAKSAFAAENCISLAVMNAVPPELANLRSGWSRAYADYESCGRLMSEFELALVVSSVLLDQKVTESLRSLQMHLFRANDYMFRAEVLISKFEKADEKDKGALEKQLGELREEAWRGLSSVVFSVDERVKADISEEGLGYVAISSIRYRNARAELMDYIAIRKWFF